MPCYSVMPCTVLSYHVFVSCCTQSYCVLFVSVIRILKCTAANYVNKLINALHKIIYDGPCDFRLNGAVNEIAL